MGTASLPELEPEYAVTGAQCEQYRRDGYILLAGMCPVPELAPYRDAVEEVTLREAGERVPLEQRDTYARAFIQITNLWRKDERVARFVLARRFGKVAAELMGVDGVRLYHDQALFKEPGGGPTPWHQDQYYWPLEGVPTVTMWMPLVDVSAEMKGMRFARGSHFDGSYTSVAISDTSDDVYKGIIEEKGFEVVQIGAMSAGDATFHSGWNIHGAPGNSTDRMRSVITVIYYADGGRISEPDHENRRRDMETWFPGQSPGEVAASAINPLVYSG